MALTQVQGQMLSGSNNTTTTIQSNGTTAITIDSSGNTTFAGSVLGTSETFQVGVNSSGKDTRFGVLSGGNGRVEFYSAGSERMRIDSSGNLLVGNTSLVEKLGIQTADGGQSVIRANATNASYGATVFYGTTTRAANSTSDFIGCYANSVAQFRVRGDGTIFAQNTTVQSVSDRSVKENIRDLDYGLDKILSLQPRRFDFKEGWGANKKDSIGFIAQEVQQFIPDIISSAKFNAGSEETHLTIGAGDLIPVLVKAIQELKAELDSVKAELQTLKGS